MISAGFRSRRGLVLGSLLLVLSVGAFAQQQEKKEYHGRKYKPLEPAATITVHVKKAANGKPIESAAVVFRATKNGKDMGGLEIKTNVDGDAKLDIIEVGSHVKVQVIAEGFATNAVEFDVPNETKDVTVDMVKPRAQVSAYENNDGKAAQRPVGIQEPPAVAKPKKQPSTAPVVIQPVDPASGQAATTSQPR